jgi:hypothetical protein
MFIAENYGKMLKTEKCSWLTKNVHSLTKKLFINWKCSKSIHDFILKNVCSLKNVHNLENVHRLKNVHKF